MGVWPNLESDHRLSEAPTIGVWPNLESDHRLSEAPTIGVWPNLESDHRLSEAPTIGDLAEFGVQITDCRRLRKSVLWTIGDQYTDCRRTRKWVLWTIGVHTPIVRVQWDCHGVADTHFSVRTANASAVSSEKAVMHMSENKAKCVCCTDL